MRLYTAINLLLEANLLNEHILNVGKFQDRYRKEDYIDKVIDMLEKSYAAIGGIKGIDRDELMDDVHGIQVQHLWQKDRLWRN